jgi:hypothetical protein
MIRKWPDRSLKRGPGWAIPTVVWFATEVIRLNGRRLKRRTPAHRKEAF